MKKKNLILYEFPIKEIRPDAREYRQNSVLYAPQLVVGCLLEINPTNFVNISNWHEKYLLWELNQGEFPEIPNQEDLILTPEGLKNLQDQLEKPYTSSPESSEVEELFKDEPAEF